MPYYNQPERIPTVQEALNQHTVDILKKLASLLPGGKVPTRKNELVDYILPYIQGQSLKQLWVQCDRIQQATIAETVHSPTDGYRKYPMPVAIEQELETLGNRYGLTTIDRDGEILLLTMADLPLAELLSRDRDV